MCPLPYPSIEKNVTISYTRGRRGRNRMVLVTRGRRGRNRVVLEFTVSIITKIVSSNPIHGEMYSMQHYVIKFVCNLRQVDGFHRVLRFLPPIKLTPTI
jgi:hypothetical protein